MEAGDPTSTGWAVRVVALLRRGLVQNVLALYGVQFVNYLLPLLTIPFLTRVLGVEGFGLYAIFQSFSLYAWTVIDYSFIMVGTREVSRQRANPQARAELIAGVVGAKLLLASAVVATGLVVQQIVPTFQLHPLIFWMGIFWGVSLAFNLLWYFQGMERMRTAAALDLSAKALATAAIFLLVDSPQAIWKVFFLYGLANLLSLSVASYLAFRPISWQNPTWRLAMATLKSGWHLFTARMAVNVFAAGNSFILGLFAPPVVVGYFAGADKIGKASVSLSEPITLALFPRLSSIIHKDPVRALRLTRRSFMAMFGIGAAMTLFIYLAAPTLIPIILGPGYEASVSLLRILSPLPFLLALTSVLGVQWMLSLRMDRIYNTVIISAVGLNLVLALLLAPNFGAKGMVWAVLISKIAEMAGVYAALVIYRVHPLHLKMENLKALLDRSNPHAD
jgi:PST family polysaccharide transporter